MVLSSHHWTQCVFHGSRHKRVELLSQRLFLRFIVWDFCQDKIYNVTRIPVTAESKDIFQNKIINSGVVILKGCLWSVWSLSSVTLLHISLFPMFWFNNYHQFSMKHCHPVLSPQMSFKSKFWAPDNFSHLPLPALKHPFRSNIISPGFSVVVCSCGGFCNSH